MTPELRIRADGRDITPVVRERLLTLTVSDSNASAADTCALTLDDRGAAIAPPPMGAALDVALGWPDEGVTPLGRFVVDERGRQGPPDTLTVRATAAGMGGNLKAPRTRAWNYPTLGALAAAIAAEHGLEPRVSRSLRDVVLPYIDQVDESDLAVLRRLAHELDLVARPAGGRLVVAPRQELAAVAGAAVPVARADVADYRLLEADRDGYVAVVTRWSGAGDAAPQEVRVGDANGEPVLRALGVYPGEAAAQNAAEARLRALQRRTATGALTLAVGRPALAAEAPVALTGFGAPVDGDWIATRTEHVLDDAGYRTTAELERTTAPWERASSTPPPEFPFPARSMPLPPAGRSPSRGRTTVVDFHGTADAIAPGSVRWLHGDIGGWPVTSAVRRVSIGEQEVCVEHADAGRWPTLALAGGVIVEGNVWVFVRLSGAWYGATWEWLRPGQVCKRIADHQFAGHIKVAPLSSWRPRSGEQVGFAVSTPARTSARTTPARSNIVTVTWP